MMVNPAMGGILTGALNGFRLGMADAQAREDREYQRQQDAIESERAAETFRQKQDQYEYERSRRGILAAQADAMHAAQMKTYGLSQQMSQHKLDRQSIDDAQDDQLYNLDVENRRENIAGARMLRAERGERLAQTRRERQREMSREQLQDMVDATRRAVAPAFIAGARSGDWSNLVGAWNESPLGKHSRVDSIEQGADGTILAVVGGRPAYKGSLEGFQEFVSQATNPDQAFAEMDERRKERYGLGAAGKRQGAAPAAIQETDAIYQRLRPLEGESENDRWMRAYSLQSQRSGQSPDQAIAGFYESTLGKLLSSNMGMAKAEELANAATQRYAERFHPNAMGGGSTGVVDGSVEAPPPRMPADPVIAAQAQGRSENSRAAYRAASEGNDLLAGSTGGGSRDGIVAIAIDREGRYGRPGGRVGRRADGTVVPLD